MKSRPSQIHSLDVLHIHWAPTNWCSCMQSTNGVLNALKISGLHLGCWLHAVGNPVNLCKSKNGRHRGQWKKGSLLSEPLSSRWVDCLRWQLIKLIFDSEVPIKVLSTTIKNYFWLFSTKYGKFRPNIQIFDYSI